MKILLILTVFLFMFSCSTNISQDKLTDSELIDASKNENILLKEGVIKDPSFIADKYPISGEIEVLNDQTEVYTPCLLYTSPSPRDRSLSRMPSSA